jgi:hypothetical protein
LQQPPREKLRRLKGKDKLKLKLQRSKQPERKLNSPLQLLLVLMI